MWWWMLLLIPLIIPAGIAGVMLIVSLVDSAESTSFASTAKLECYHCGQKTNAQHRVCKHCGGELQ